MYTISGSSGGTLLIFLLLLSSSKVCQSTYVAGWTFNDCTTWSDTRTLSETLSDTISY
ncbi:MAG: hypothetical protein ABJA32_05195 [Ginsengibacter sp.]